MRGYGAEQYMRLQLSIIKTIHCPKLKTKDMKISKKYVEKVLGIKLTNQKIKELLTKMATTWSMKQSRYLPIGRHYGPNRPCRRHCNCIWI